MRGLLLDTNTKIPWEEGINRPHIGSHIVRVE